VKAGVKNVKQAIASARKKDATKKVKPAKAAKTKKAPKKALRTTRKPTPKPTKKTVKKVVKKVVRRRQRSPRS